MNLVSNKLTYEFSPDEIKKLIATELKVDVNKVSVDYLLQEVNGDPLDRFPGVLTVTKIRVTVNNK